jgi:uncharacterized NAD-dependent epimerase/dehydratase family protein
VILQHAPARRDYDGFPGHRLHPLADQIRAVELIGGCPVVAIAVNSEGLEPRSVRAACAAISDRTGRPAVEPLRDGVEPLVEAIAPLLPGAAG